MESALPEMQRHYYAYPAAPTRAEVIFEDEPKRYMLRYFRMRRVEFPLHLPSDIALKDADAFKRSVEELEKTDRKTAQDRMLLYTNRIDFYIPADLKPGEKRPVILVSSILGGTMVVDHFARYYAGRGFIAALVHRKRVYWDDKQDMQQVEDYLRASIIRLRQAIDWIELQPEVDPERIGSFGISYGAILHAVLAAVEPRIRFHVLAMPAGPIADVIMDCPDKAITKLVRQVHEKYGWDHDFIYKQLQETIVTDPMIVAPYIPRERVQVYISLFDKVVGASRSWDLWRKMGKPELRLMPFGHYGGVAILPYLQSASLISFKRNLNP